MTESDSVRFRIFAMQITASTGVPTGNCGKARQQKCGRRGFDLN
jgi:hypothetical protein